MYTCISFIYISRGETLFHLVVISNLTACLPLKFELLHIFLSLKYSVISLLRHKMKLI